jgi:hypothetical protein
MEKLAAMIQAGQIACVNHDWRSKESAPFASVQERFPLTAFDARCVLSEYYHRRGDVNAALGWAREGLACWYRFASVSITGPSAVEVGTRAFMRVPAARKDAHACFACIACVDVHPSDSVLVLQQC